ncbi:hypothetical protein BBJ28_00000887 [Nothophytophthora sp. Chile5]|nr:hypothetical protein BBJ28_00000887 [Nothophytophthora sp. Chile5]
MPLAPRFTWEEDASSIVLELHLPGTALRNIDIYVSDLVVKVNAAPYVLLLDLQDAVDDASAVVKSNPASNLLRISLQKQSSRLWKQLECQDTKKALRERRDASMDRKRESETALSAKRKERKHQEEKQTLRAQMAVDDANRQILTDLKAEEKEREEKLSQQHPGIKQAGLALNNQDGHLPGNKGLSKPPLSKKAKKKVSFATTLHDSDDHHNRTASNQLEEEEIIELTADGSFDIANTKQTPPPSAPESHEELREVEHTEPLKKAAKSEAIEEENDPPVVQEVVVELPPPRESMQSEIHFTPRVFPTPSRESKAAEEEDWLLKNRKHINQHQGLNRTSGYDISETDPMWLKAKGDDFFHAKDFRSAINAYTEAISATSNDNTELIATCLSNRAACLLQLEEFKECITDCSKALSHLPDTRDTDGGASVLKHYRLKLKLFVRRGTAYCREGQYSQAKADYGVAYSMDNQNPQLHDDFMELVAMEKAQELKGSGDQLFREGKELDRAIQMYSDSLTLNPLSIACLSNRAACHLMRHAAKECIQDCTQALELLQQDIGSKQGQDHGLAFFSVGPAAGSAQRRAWVVKTLVRRGAAHVSIRAFDQGKFSPESLC